MVSQMGANIGGNLQIVSAPWTPSLPGLICMIVELLDLSTPASLSVMSWIWLRNSAWTLTNLWPILTNFSARVSAEICRHAGPAWKDVRIEVSSGSVTPRVRPPEIKSLTPVNARSSDDPCIVWPVRTEVFKGAFSPPVPQLICSRFHCETCSN